VPVIVCPAPAERRGRESDLGRCVRLAAAPSRRTRSSTWTRRRSRCGTGT